jgi:cytochrome c heme-lyase
MYTRLSSKLISNFKQKAEMAVVKCPVDHRSEFTKECPVDQTAQNAQSTWNALLPKSNKNTSSSFGTNAPLSTHRELSSIPKTDDGNWVYPSEAQFFTAMARKNHNPQPADMKTIVPIHNAVNERAWGVVMRWEAGRGGEVCGGIRLINFKGKPGRMSPKARWKSLLGYVVVDSNTFFTN